MKWMFTLMLLVSAFAFALTPYSSAATPTDVDATAMTEKVDYVLPYPGILPDHPLFFLKTMRDQIMEKLIGDPVRKVEFYVLQSDKYINMGVFLVAKQKETLAVQTMMIGTARMKMAIDFATKAKDEGKEIPVYVLERFTKALAKYKEVVGELTDQAIGEKKDLYTGIMDEILKLQETAARLEG